MSDIPALATIDGDQAGDPMFVDVTLGTQEPYAILYDTSKENSKISDSTYESPSKETVSTAKPTPMKNFRCMEQVNSMQCVYNTTDEDRLIRHVRKVHRGENPFQCMMCEYTTYNKSLFEEHVRIHQGIKPFKCRFCSYCSASKKNAKKHELIHRPDNPLRCTQCDFIARHERSLSYHTSTVHKQSATQDSGEPVSNYSPGELPTQLTCSKCQVSASSPEALEAHDCAGPVKKLKCDICGASFRNKKNFKLHVKNAKKCEDCDVLLCNKIKMVRHMSSAHGKSVAARSMYTCEVCQWSGTNHARILLHLIHHPADAPDVPGIEILKKYGIVR